MKKRILIIGYGNPLRRDDGVGWEVTNGLHDEISSSNITIMARHQLTPELCETISHFDQVILIDAAAGTCPGEITCKEVNSGPVNTPTFSHQFTPEILLGTTQELFHACPRILIYTIVGEDFDYGEGLSDCVKNKIPALVEAIKSHLDAAGK
ncbi:hydrogenase maturation protease [bacterium]|nr:hydrogenase maturation protease [bacterium]